MIAPWSAPRTIPAAPLLQGEVSLATAGMKTIEGEVALRPGWYVAALAITGGTPTLTAARTPLVMDGLLQPLGALTSPWYGLWANVLLVTDRASQGFAFLSAEST